MGPVTLLTRMHNCAGHGECPRGSNLVLGAESHLKIPARAIDGVLHCTGSDYLDIDEMYYR
ncbi:hypothetical protein Taro_021423 [Colocasia esculenta]|uniref:Uncharacterized protein n=1 Tax=Colocasia esculenta TaxID=4460 RepID=A0A843UYT7_COLES|nr:hypothetical protein [Colocasia esculenta]